MANPLPQRPPRDDVTKLEAEIDRLDFWRLAPETVNFPDWLTLPAGVPHGPYTTPTKSLLKEVEAGLEQLVKRENGADLEPVPVTGCDVCAALDRQRQTARAAGSWVTVQSCNAELANHPHRRADRS